MKNVVHKVKMSVLALFFVAGLSAAGLISPTVLAATDPCPNGGTLNEATARCEYAATPAYSEYCPSGWSEGLSNTCYYNASDPTCDTSGYVFDPFTSSTHCLGPTPTGEAQYECNGLYTLQGPAGEGCYPVEAVALSELCPQGGSYVVSSPTRCSAPISTSTTYNCNNGDTLASATCSYLAVVGTMTDSQPSTDVTIPEGSTITVDGTRDAITVELGGKLMGTGTVGALTVAQYGTVAPGHSPGVLQSGNLTLNGIYEFELGGTAPGNGDGYHDQINVTGTVDVTNGTLVPSLYGGFVPTVGQVFVIINNDGSDAVTGEFGAIPEGSKFYNDGVTYVVSYVGGDGNDITLTVDEIDTTQLPAGSNVPTVPNTGFQLLFANPLLTLALSLVSVGIILVIARKLNLRNA